MQKVYFQRGEYSNSSNSNPKRVLAGRVATKGDLAALKGQKNVDYRKPRISPRKIGALVAVPGLVICLQFLAPQIGFTRTINLPLLWLVISMIGILVVWLVYLGFKLVRNEIRELSPSDAQNSDGACGMTITARASAPTRK